MDFVQFLLFYAKRDQLLFPKFYWESIFRFHSCWSKVWLCSPHHKKLGFLHVTHNKKAPCCLSQTCWVAITLVIDINFGSRFECRHYHLQKLSFNIRAKNVSALSTLRPAAIKKQAMTIILSQPKTDILQPITTERAYLCALRCVRSPCIWELWLTGH